LKTVGDTRKKLRHKGSEKPDRSDASPSALRKLTGDESGAVLVLVAVLMVAFLVLVAMSVDLGDLYAHDRDLQTAADAGALAGAQELIYAAGAPGPAAVKAVEYVDRNAEVSHVEGANLDSWAPAVDARSVTVDLREHGIPFMFAPVIGQTEGAVTAHARAEVKYVTGVNKLFPVALNYMNPYRFRFLIQRGGSTVSSFDVSDPNGDGVFDALESGGSFTPPAAGWYDITLQAIDKDGVAGVQLDNIGGWWAADPAGKLLRVGMSRAIGGGTVTVRIQVAASVTDPKISAKLGNDGFDLLPKGGGIYEGPVTAPTKTGNDGWEAHDLTIDKKIVSGTIARYVAFHPDVPLKYLMFFDSFYGGYSGGVGASSSITAKVVTRVLRFGDEYVMKLGNQAGAGIYAGNWRIADIYAGQNTHDEIATVPIPDGWTLNHPLVIGGPLEPQPGASVGQIKGGLNDRLSGHSPAFTVAELQTLTLDQVINRMPPDDPYFAIIPIVEFTSMHGSSDPYKIQAFAGYYITSYSKAGDVNGVFIRWAAPGDWSDTKPPGNLYIETAVMTE